MYVEKPESNCIRRIFPRALAACIGAALTAWSHAAVPAPRDPAGSFTVTNCSDSDPGSLRDALSTNADVIDLTQLSCSLITLTSGELSTQADRLYISGRGITISAGGASRVLSHHGHDTLYIGGVDFADGIVTENRARGGCLYSEGNLQLGVVSVHDCSVASTSDYFTKHAVGGGIFARGFVKCFYSTVRDNSTVPAAGGYSYSYGGGIYADSIDLSHSTVSGNRAGGSIFSYSSGGGLMARSGLSVFYSTISGNNSAAQGGGARFGNGNSVSRISNSTISGNTVEFGAGGGLASGDGFLVVSNSTIGFNVAEQGAFGAGLIMRGPAEYLSLNNSILANNRGGDTNDDLRIDPSFPSGADAVFGSSNIVVTANVALPADTIRDDPRLAPLADNGGPTFTHALLPGSPARDAGHDVLTTNDQRGTGFPRKIGTHVDLGAYEVQDANALFANGFD